MNNFQEEITRLRSFNNWTDPIISPRRFAAAGFYYASVDDAVRCFECGLQMRGWSNTDDPAEKHRLSRPECRFVRQEPCGNIPLGTGTRGRSMVLRPSRLTGRMDSQPGTSAQQSERVQGPPTPVKSELVRLFTEQVNRYPEYMSHVSRLNSFSEWSILSPMSPLDLANAGLFYTGEGDRCHCYACGGVFQAWEAGQSPWIEHARWHPACHFLLHMKGRTFIQRVVNNNLNASEPQESSPEPRANRSKSPKTKTISGICILCCSREIEINFVNCGHAKTCRHCTARLDACPICRERISVMARIFLE